MADPVDPIERQQAQAEADKAAAEASKARAEAEKAQAEADKAKAEAEKAQLEAAKLRAETEPSLETDPDIAAAKKQSRLAALERERTDASKAAAEAAKAEAEAAKLASEARKAQAELDQSPEADPTVAEARKAARLADLAKQQAEAKAAAEKSAIPEPPTLATIAEPADKSISLADTAGVATARWTATEALSLVGGEIAMRVFAAIRGPQPPTPRGGIFGFGRGGTEPEPANPVIPPVFVMDTTTVSEADLLRLQLTARLNGFIAAFSPPVVEGQPPQGDEAARPAGDMGAFAAAAVITTASNVVRFGVELVSALRTRYAIFGRDVTLDRTALVAGIVGGLVRQRVPVRWPKYAPVPSSPLINLYGLANDMRDAFESRVIPDGSPTDAEPTSVKAARKLLAAFDAYATAITTAPAAGTPAPLVEAALIEAAVPPAASPVDIMLFVDISAQGADAVTGYGIVKGSSAAFVGFVQAYYVLARRDGTIVDAGSVTRHVPAKLDLTTANLMKTA